MQTIMEKLNFDCVFGAVNAMAIDDRGQFAYFFDPRVDATIRVNLCTGSKEVLVWYDREFRHRRWLCYCLFAVTKNLTTFLPTLFYNTKRKQFILVTFVADSEKKVLYTIEEAVINVDGIRPDRLAYNAHKDDDKIHIIFYERFTRHGSPTGERTLLSYVNCCYDCGSHRFDIRKGVLPEGQWELPFIAHRYLHFISTEQVNTQLASIPAEEDITDNEWDIRVISNDSDDVSPPRKAVWCNAWRCGMGWYVIAQKIVTDEDTTQKITLWQLDVLDCQWRLLPTTIEVPSTGRNFALRIEDNNMAYLHFDLNREGALFKFDLVELMSQRTDDAAVRRKNVDGFIASKPMKAGKGDSIDNSTATTPISPTEIICPVCLDTYQDPRTLNCGHSICYNCAEQMRVVGQSNIIRCFACRKSTIIPACGLPVNYSLKDAIETLIKAKQLKLSGLRCGTCRKSCDEKNLWICLECAAKNFICSNPDDGIASRKKLGKKFSFCAQCILKHHNNHKVDEFSKFRERSEFAEKMNEKYKKAVKEVLQSLKNSITELTDSAVITPLRDDVLLELINACDAITMKGDEIEVAGEEVVHTLREYTKTITDSVEKSFKDLMDGHLLATNGPTEL